MPILEHQNSFSGRGLQFLFTTSQGAVSRRLRSCTSTGCTRTLQPICRWRLPIWRSLGRQPIYRSAVERTVPPPSAHGGCARNMPGSSHRPTPYIYIYRYMYATRALAAWLLRMAHLPVPSGRHPMAHGPRSGTSRGGCLVPRVQD